MPRIQFCAQRQGDPAAKTRVGTGARGGCIENRRHAARCDAAFDHRPQDQDAVAGRPARRIVCLVDQTHRFTGGQRNGNTLCRTHQIDQKLVPSRPSGTRHGIGGCLRQRGILGDAGHPETGLRLVRPVKAAVKRDIDDAWRCFHLGADRVQICHRAFVGCHVDRGKQHRHPAPSRGNTKPTLYPQQQLCRLDAPVIHIPVRLFIVADREGRRLQQQV